MAGRNWCAAARTSGVGKGNCALRSAAGFFVTVVWLFSTHCGPPSREVKFVSNCNDVAWCSLPAFLLSSAVPGTPGEADSRSRRREDRTKLLHGFALGARYIQDALHALPEAAKALGDAVGKALAGPSMWLYGRERSARLPSSERATMRRDGEGRKDDLGSANVPRCRMHTRRKRQSKQEDRERVPNSPAESVIKRSKHNFVVKLPVINFTTKNAAPTGPVFPLQPSTPQPGTLPPSWLVLQDGQLRGIPLTAQEAGIYQQRARYLPSEGVWKYLSEAPNPTEEGSSGVSGRAVTDARDLLISGSRNAHISAVLRSFRLLMVFPEEKVLFTDKEAVGAIANAASAIASTVVNHPSENSRSLSVLFPVDNPFYVVPIRATALFEKFAMLPGRFLGEGSFGIVFEGMSSTGVRLAVKICVQTSWGPMTPSKEARLISECEASEMRIPELFPGNLDPPTLFYQYRMVVPLLTGHVAHLPATYPLGKNMHGTRICTLYPSALCDLQQLSSTMSLPPAVQMEVTRSIVTVVARLHLLGIVHLDIKLANFLIDREGRVLLSDFGLATRKQRVPVMVSCRSGSPAFMSPEMIRCLASNKYTDGKIELSSKLDAFSLGVTLYMIWCNALPFDSVVTGSSVNSLVDALDKIYSKGEQVSFHRCPGGDISDSEVKAIISEFLRFQPERRATPLDVVRASTIFLKKV